MKIKLYNNIADIGLGELPKNYEVGAEITDEDGIVVRSADLHEVAFGKNLRAIARAGAGVNNIPVDICTENGICVFNTPGANAGAVRELCIAALLLTSRKISDGIEWAKTLAGDPDALKTVEKEKKKFTGPEIFGKTLGIIGLGAIGSGLAKSAYDLGMKIVGYDPFMKEETKKTLSEFCYITEDIDDVYKSSDYISIHVPSLPATKGMICAEKIALMKDGARLLNLARADLVNEDDLIRALEDGKISAYFTDFPTGKIAGKKNVIATPHLGASTPEAEDNCAVMACREIADFLDSGNVKNSVNFPAAYLPETRKHRISVLFCGEKEKITSLLGDAKFAYSQRGDISYVLAESENEFDLLKIGAVSGVKRLTAYK